VEEYAASGPVYWLLLNMEANVEVDITAMYALDALRQELTDEGIVLALTRVKHDLWTPLERFGLVESIGPDYIFPTLPVAVDAYHRWLAAHGLTDAGPS